MRHEHRDSDKKSRFGSIPKNNMVFERSALALVGAFVSVLVSAAFISPPDSGTASPNASIGMAEPLILSEGLLPLEVSSEPIESLVDFDVAAGPAIPTAKSLNKTFGRLGYHLEKIKSGDNLVPRVFLTSLPTDLAKVRENSERKDIFFQAMLPLVLQVNEEILDDRRHLWKLRYQISMGQKPSPADRLWLRVMTERYKVKAGDLNALISRIDIIPPSLALAQAAEESGWGSSRFAKEGNAVFGQWTWSDVEGLIPKKRDEGKTHKVRAFDTVMDSVRAYSLNLNSHRAYKKFRKARQALRRSGGELNGHALAGTLTKYSERGQDYVIGLRNMIDHNDLRALDSARLDDIPPGEQTASAI